jgi:hypothetical protein
LRGCRPQLLVVVHLHFSLPVSISVHKVIHRCGQPFDGKDRARYHRRVLARPGRLSSAARRLPDDRCAVVRSLVVVGLLVVVAVFVRVPVACKVDRDADIRLPREVVQAQATWLRAPCRGGSR